MPQTPVIQLLPDHVVNKIAAGEVVERPASVLKELLENALDAGAERIEVEAISGGRRLIAVTDDGVGMGRDQALLSVERHATSKIRDVDDIERIDTLGFRGEALAALASVSRFTLTSCPRGQTAGTEVSISGGRLRDVREVGAPAGTRVEVRNLFHNVPARRKFLRTDPTELAHLRQMFLVHALAYPAVAMRLVVDEREVYQLAGEATLEDRLRELFGRGMMDGLRPVAYRDVEVTVTGYAGLPRTSRADRSEQYVFVNGRPAGAPILANAIREAYQSLVPKGRHPVLFLFIETDPAQVDVNVHPTKKEVRFRRSREVRDGVLTALREALETSGSPARGEGPPERPGGRPDEPRLRITDLPELEPFPYPRLAPPGGDALPATGPAADSDSKSAPRPSVSSGKGPWGWCRILGQAGGLYVILETSDGIVLMDPHAAHERVHFERFMRQVLDRKVRSQGLLAPETVDLSPQDALSVRKNTDLLREMGFGVSDFGGDSFIVDALPACLGNASSETVLGAVAASLERAGPRGGTQHWAEEQVARAACKASVKANDALKTEEIEQLIVDLAAAEMPYTCPHGRPTMILMSYSELERKFGRA